MMKLRILGLSVIFLLLLVPTGSADIPIVPTINDETGDVSIPEIDINQTGYIAGNTFIVSTYFEAVPVLNSSIDYTMTATFYGANDTKLVKINLVVSNNETQATLNYDLNTSDPKEDVATTADSFINNKTLAWDIEYAEIDDSIFGAEGDYWFNFYLEVSFGQETDRVNFDSKTDTNTEPLISPFPGIVVGMSLVLLPLIYRKMK